MKFGEHLKANSLPNWKTDYLNYDLLKGFIKQHPNWQDADQYEFIKLLTQEYHRITDFIDQHTLELRKRIQHDDWVDILLNTYDFSRFVQLNQTGFDKIIKKHKKYTHRTMDLVFVLVFDDVALYTSLRKSNDHKQPVSSTQLFTSKKYWLSHDHVPQVVAHLCMHMLVDHHSNLSNSYMDNERMECYLDRLNDKQDAIMIKFKSYQDDIYIEHEIHNTFHFGDVQYKQRDKVVNMDLSVVANQDIKDLCIMLQCDYTRIRFYSPQFPSLSVTLDTNITYTRPQSPPTCFNFAVLEVKQTGTTDQPIPLKELASLLERLHHVPKFSKYLHGVYQQYGLVPSPPWIGLEKNGSPPLSPSLQRPSCTTIQPVRPVQPDYTSIHVPDTPPPRSKPKGLIAYDPSGNPVYKKKRPKEPEIEAIKIEPKVFFANERTFIAWLQFCALLLTVALNLLNFGDVISRICGAIFLAIAVVLSLYALFRFQHRARMLRHQRAQGRYDDTYGPAVLCILIVGALVINFWLRFHN